MKQCCGTCRQFERNKHLSTDTCGAWDQPTRADRFACQFWMPKLTRDEKSHIARNRQNQE